MNFLLETAKKAPQQARVMSNGTSKHAAPHFSGDALAQFKATMGKHNPNCPALPETAVKTQSFGGWIG
jgi:hypothetical protein